MRVDMLVVVGRGMLREDRQRFPKWSADVMRAEHIREVRAPLCISMNEWLETGVSM